MKRSRTGSIVAAVVAGMLGLAGVAWAQLAGVLTAVSPRSITVGDAVYELQKDTAIEDMTSHPIALSELRAGVQVELDFDEEGRLATIRANVVR